MSYNLIWIFLVTIHTFAASSPLPNQYDLGVIGMAQDTMIDSPQTSKFEDFNDSPDEKVISVRITSSVAVGRGKGKDNYRQPSHMPDPDLQDPAKVSTEIPMTINTHIEEVTQKYLSDVPPNLEGANIEYIKQLNAKKGSKEHSSELVHSFQQMEKGQENVDESEKVLDEYAEDIKDIPLARKVASTANANGFQEKNTNREFQNPDMNAQIDLYAQQHHINITNEALFEPSNNFGLKIDKNKVVENLTISTVDHRTSKAKGIRNIDTFVSNNYHNDDSVAESSIKSVEFAKYHENFPSAGTIPPAHSPNNIQTLPNRSLNLRRNDQTLTTVSFNIVHDKPKATNENDSANSFMSSSQVVPKQQFYEPPKIYSQPAKIYSEPAKFYSEPAKIYSEPAKIYSEPAKVYSEPAKIYSEPSKFYSEPASLHLNQNFRSSIAPNYSPWQRQPQRSTAVNTTPLTTATNTFQQDSIQMEHQPEKNYEVDENISVLTDGRSHGVQQETSTEKCKQDNCKVGYVVEGRQFKKYRVEERTSDGFIVGEYGVVRNEDGALRGVRYTADSDASPRLIHDALMKFLQLK